MEKEVFLEHEGGSRRIRGPADEVDRYVAEYVGMGERIVHVDINEVDNG